MNGLNATNISSGLLSVAQGGTGAGTAAEALASLGAASLTASNSFSAMNLLTNTANAFADRRGSWLRPG